MTVPTDQQRGPAVCECGHEPVEHSMYGACLRCLFRCTKYREAGRG